MTSHTDTFEQGISALRSGRAVEAQRLLTQCIEQAHPQHASAHAALGQMAVDRGDAESAIAHFDQASKLDGGNPQHGLDLAFALTQVDRLEQARESLRVLLRQHADCFNGWLMAGQVAEALGQPADSLRCYLQAVTRAQSAGWWLDEQSTPPAELGAVMHAITQVRSRRRELLFASFDEVRQREGATSVRRVEQALANYLRESVMHPPSTQQKPRLFYFPGLPSAAYADPFLQPWAPQLQQAFPDIRREALQTLAEDSHFENFVRFREGVRVEDYLRGNGAPPAWEAFFFYRHGLRYDQHHARCPATSGVLEAITLCRIDGEAPEICFSVLTPGSEILPHHGVTNVRMVMHLPLQVPANCALSVADGGEHHWQEGRLMMFDDTYLHEAWNRSAESRVILLMDCWNPYLDSAERQATKLLLETIGCLGRASRQQRAADT